MRSAHAWHAQPWVCCLAEAAILASLLALLALRLEPDPWLLTTRGFVIRSLLVVLTLQLCLYYNDLYEDFAGRRVELFVRLGQSVGVGGAALALIYYAYPPLNLGRDVLALYIPSAFCAIVAWRFLFLWGAGHEALVERVLILGTGQSGLQLAREVERRTPLGFVMVGLLGETKDEVGRHASAPVIGTTTDLVGIVRAQRVGRIVVALDDRRTTMPMAALLQCRMDGVDVEEGSAFHERIAGNISVHNLRPSWLVFASGFDQPRLVRNTKRAADFVGALLLLVLLSPLLLLLGLLVKLTSAGPVFYRQERVGEKGQVFWLIKFRSMRADAEAATGPVWMPEQRDPRVTWLGRWLRRFRLDELPQLLNVLSGEMSFVGPRPERPHFVSLLRKVVPYYDQRHNIKPGITGWAQIKFGYGSTIEDSERKLQFDLYYVKNMSFLLDLAIVLDTIKVMLPFWGERYSGRR